MRKKRPGCAMGVHLFLAGVLAGLPGCAGMRPAETPTGPHFTVLSYNVNWGCPRPDLAVETIRRADADVVCLQEINETWERHLRPGLTGVYPFMTFKPSSGAGGMAVLSKRSFREVYHGRSERGWFPAWVVVAETSVGPIQLVNVHLRPVLREDGGFSAGVYLQTKDERREEVQETAGHVEPGLPTIFAGDFNEGDDGRAVAFLRERSFTDALQEFDPHARTWEWGSAGSPVKLTGRLDHILYSTTLRCLDARVIQSGASDHFPVTATFEKLQAPAPN